MALDLRERAPRYIQSVALWGDLLDSVNDVLLQVQTEMSEKEHYLDIDYYSDTTKLASLARAFGYNPNLILAGDDLDFLKQEVSSIVFKIKNKGTLYYYNYIFKLIPYSGKIYTLIYDNTDDHLFRAFNYDGYDGSVGEPDFITNLNTATINEPFIGSTSIVEPGYTYDNQFGTIAYINYLNDNGEDVRRTKHLAIEYVIDKILIEDSVEYLMTELYMRYLYRAVDYGRKVTTYPHVGCQLNILTDETGFFNSNDTGVTGYSVADLQLNSSVTNYYGQVAQSPFFLDSDRYLDTAIQWYLDNDEVAPDKTNEEKFYYIYAGTGTKTLIPDTDLDYYYTIDDMYIYLPFDLDTQRTVQNLGDLADVVRIVGTYEYTTGVDGIINKSLEFDGSTTRVEIVGLTIPDGNQSYAVWINGTHADQVATDPYIYSHTGLIEIWYDTSEQKIVVDITGSITLSGAITLDGTDNFLFVELNQSSGNATLYINNVAVDTDATLGTIGTLTVSAEAYIGSRNTVNYFTGLIDEFRIYSVNLPAERREYLYDERAGSLGFLNNPIYKNRIIGNQIHDGDGWTIISGWIPAKAITDEVVAEGDASTKEFSGSLSHADLRRKYFRLIYTSGATTYTIVDDGEGAIGSLVSNYAEGTVNYTTGAWTLTTEKSLSIALEYLYQNVSQTSFVATLLDNTPVTPGTFEITYTIGGEPYIATDDGAGGIDGPVDDSGTIGTIIYSTGSVSMTFSAATDSDASIHAAYEHINDTTPNANSFIFAEYRTDEDIQITEVGIANDDDRIVAYATFPPIQFKDMFNHASFQFSVQKP